MPKAKAKTNAQHFIICEMADEYNDEIYRLQDSGTPVQVYTDKAEAEKECMRRQIERMRGLEVGSYAIRCRGFKWH